MIGPWEVFAAATALAAAGGAVALRRKPGKTEGELAADRYIEEQNPDNFPPPVAPSRRRRPPRPVSAAKRARVERDLAEARARDARLREVIDNLPSPPPDPERVTAPEDIAKLRRAWERWHADLSDEQRNALRVAHHRALLQKITPRR